MKPNKFQSQFVNTRTIESRVFNRPRNDENDTEVWLYRANDVGYEYNRKGYHHKRDGGICYLLAFTKSGKATLKYRDKSYILTPGSFIFINLGEPSVIEAYESDWEIYFIHLFGPQADNFYQSFYKSQGNYMEFFNATNFINSIDEIYHSYLTNQHKYQISRQIYSLLIDVIEKAEKKSGYSDVVDKALAILNSQYVEDINLDQLCEKLYISKYYFIRKFTKEVNMTPKKYLTNIRIDRARVLLVTTNLKISEIVALTGFKSEENMFYAFKKELNVSPDYYRKNVYK